MKVVSSSSEENSDTKDEESEWFQILAILIGSLASFTCGMLLAWPSPFMLKIVEDKATYNVTEDQAALFAVLNLVGLIILTPLLVPVVDVIGAKKAIIIAMIPYSTIWLIKAFSTNLYGLYFARLLVGCGDALIIPYIPVYIGEISTPKVRGLWGNAFICSVFTGQFAINALGAYINVKTTSLISLTIPVLVLIFFPFMPESPYFCIVKGRLEDARTSLRTLRRRENVDEEFKAIEIAIHRQLSESGKWKDLFTIRANRKALLAGVFLRSCQIFGGIITIASYTQFIFQKSGSSIDPKLSSVIYTAVSCTSHTCGSLASSKLGRRKSLLISLFLAATVLSLVGIYFLIETNYPNIDFKSFRCIPLVGLLVYIICCALGLGTVPTLMLSELFSTTVKTKGVAIVTSAFGLSAIIMNNVFYSFYNLTGFSGPFFIFAAFNFAAIIATFSIIPETKDKTLEEIQLLLRQKRNKRNIKTQVL